jgi:hypothetical protein
MGHVLMARPVHHKTQGAMVELADTPVLGTGVARREGSSPFRPTTHRGQLAQLVEHLVDIEGVRGSSPLPPTTKAPMVKWHHTSMVRMNPKFDPWLGHHIKTSYIIRYKGMERRRIAVGDRSHRRRCWQRHAVQSETGLSQLSCHHTHLEGQEQRQRQSR